MNPVPSRPNFLIFLVDQFPARYLEHDSQCILPNLRRLAAEGITFIETFGPSPHCCPARATFMTGLYPSRHGVWNNVNQATALSQGPRPGVRHFSESLKEAGYHLAHAGKWHVSSEQTPADVGWEELSPYKTHVCADALNRWRSADVSFDETARRNHFRRPGWGDGRVLGPHSHQSYKENPFYASAIEPAINALAALSSGERPWALCVSTDMSPAEGAPADTFQLYDPAKMNLPASFGDTLEDKPRIYQRMRNQNWGQISIEEVRESLANYMALCTMQDRMLGDLLDALDAAGQSDNTVVLFVGDHGDHQFAHGLLDMGIHAFRESYHVPAVVRWPRGLRNPGREVSELVSLADFAPTFIELAGGKTSQRMTGNSLAPFLRDEAPLRWRDALFHQTNGNELYFVQRTVRTKQWRYTYNGFDFDELYDLENDPHEMINLAFPVAELQPVRYPETMAERDPYAPWPRLPDQLDAVRRDMMSRLWEFAIEEEDRQIFNPYAPVCLQSYGPGITLQHPEAGKLPRTFPKNCDGFWLNR